jgi:hypothetical protein
MGRENRQTLDLTLRRLERRHTVVVEIGMGLQLSCCMCPNMLERSAALSTTIGFGGVLKLELTKRRAGGNPLVLKRSCESHFMSPY